MTTPAMRVLDLQTEYTQYEEHVAALAEYRFEPERTREQIAAEYEVALRELLTP